MESNHILIRNATLPFNSSGALPAVSCYDDHVRLWRISEGQMIVAFSHPRKSYCITFSTDGKYRLRRKYTVTYCSRWHTNHDAFHSHSVPHTSILYCCNYCPSLHCCMYHPVRSLKCVIPCNFTSISGYPSIYSGDLKNVEYSYRMNDI